MVENNEEKNYPADEQGITKDETTEEIQEDIKTGEKEADIYTKEGRDELVEEDEISAEEAGFMEGEESKEEPADDQDEEPGNCSDCGKNISIDSAKTKEIRGNLLHFCSAECLKNFDKKEEKTEIIFGDEVPEAPDTNEPESSESEE